jgi:plasmid replication initiation protein
MDSLLDKKTARTEAKKQLAIVERQEKAARYDALTVERPSGERWVTMSNALTRAAHGLTLGEKRIIMAAVSKLDSMARPIHGQAVPTTKITAAEYAELAECEPNAAYEALQTAAKNLYNRSIVMFEPSFKRGDRKIGDKGTVTHMRWVGRAKYHDKEAWIELAWWHEVVPHLMGLRKNFTSYQLQQASALRSVYSWRLLELLTRFKSTGKAEYTIEDFCTSMQATEKQRADFNNIRRRMIEPAVKELTQKDGWLIQWEPIKAGRKVKSLRFTFMRNPQGNLFSENSA